MTTEQSISVLGATGKTGRRVTAQLRSEGHRVKAASRRGPYRFDWDDQATWNSIVRDADGIYLLPHEAPGGNERLATFTGLAADGGVRRLVLLSAREWTDIGLTESLEREDIVRDSGLAWTILRPVWFAQNFSEEPFLAKGVDDGELVHGTGEGRHPFVDVRDIAAVASAALTDDRHAGQHYALTGARAISVDEAAQAIATATSRTIRTRALAVDAYRDYLSQHYPPETIEGVVTLSERIRRGQDAYLSDGVQRALGREPRDFSENVDESTSEGVWER